MPIFLKKCLRGFHMFHIINRQTIQVCMARYSIVARHSIVLSTVRMNTVMIRPRTSQCRDHNNKQNCQKGKKVSSMAMVGLEPATFRLAVECFNHVDTGHLSSEGTYHDMISCQHITLHSRHGIPMEGSTWNLSVPGYTVQQTV